MKTDYELVNELYMSYVNEQSPFMQRKIKEDIKKRVSKCDLLMYSARFAIPFKAFRDIFPLVDLFKTLEEMEKRGEDISGITSKTLLIQGVEDIQGLNQISKEKTPTKVQNFRLKLQGSNLFEYGDVKSIGEKFPYAVVNYIDIETVEQMSKGEKDYRGVPIIITIDSMGELPLDKLSDIEKKFDVAGVRIIERDRNANIEERTRPISVTSYKEIRETVDKDIINKLYVTENASKTYVDTELATQIMCSIVDKVKYDEEYKGIWEQTSPERWFSYFSDVSNITGLVTGKTICGGYSEILRNVASCVGLKCKTMVGKTVIDSGHAWNQIELGDTWFNTDLTWAAKEIAAGKPTGDLFMSDAAFFGDRRDMIFEQGKTEVVIGGHERVCNTNGKKCGSYIEPYVTEILMKNVRKYEEKYKTHGKSPDYNGAVPYVGSSIQKMRSSTKDSERPVGKLH